MTDKPQKCRAGGEKSAQTDEFFNKLEYLEKNGICALQIEEKDYDHFGVLHKNLIDVGLMKGLSAFDNNNPVI